MSYGLDPETGEVLRSEQLRDAILSLIPPVAIKKQMDVEVQYPLPRPNSLSFVDIEYLPLEEEDNRLRLFVVETQSVLTNGAETTALRSHREYRGTAKKCWIDPETGEIQQYYEAIGKLDTWETFFVEDDPSPFLQGEEPTTHEEWLGQSIIGRRPKSNEESRFNELAYELQLFTKDKLDILFGYFVELGVVDQ